MTTILKLAKIKSLLSSVDVVAEMHEGFVQYSNGNAVVPPVGELVFDHPPGDVHIKYGYIKGHDYYVIKIASGFYDNPKLGISSSQGLMLLFNQNTGVLESVLLDEGHLTDIRTAAAGALAAKFFAPKNLKAIGIIGTGIQARLQLDQIQQVKPCKSVWLWGRNQKNAVQMKSELEDRYNVHIAATCAEVAQNANLIVTTTSSDTPLLRSSDIRPGTLIVAIGSDTEHKQELDGDVLHKADLVISDSLPQSKSRGEVFRAVKEGAINRDDVIELGSAIQQVDLHHTNDEQIIVVDLTGVAVQDIMIASAVYKHYIN